MEKKVKRSFVFNIDWRDVLMDYPAEVRYEVYDAIIEYAASGKLLELKPLAKMAFSFIKKEMDFNYERYKETVAKRSEAGKKGMSVRYAAKGDLTYVTSDNKTNKSYQVVTKLTSDNKTNIYDNEYADDKWEDKSSTPQSPPGGEEGGTDYLASSLSQRDGIPRNFDGLCREMQALGIPQRQQDEIMRLSNFGQIGHPVWQHLKHCRESRDARLEKNRVKLPGSYILKQLRASTTPNPGPKPQEGPRDE